LNIDLSTAAQALNGYESDGKRQYIYQTEGHTVISDCYNAAPESMKAALSVLAVSEGRKIAVLGDMLELGDETVALHKQVGTYTSESADVLITYGELAKYIAEGSAVKEKYSFSADERDALHQFLKGFIKKDDTILYKASNGMQLSALIV